MYRSNWLLRYTSNNLSLILKSIGYKSKFHLLMMDFDLLLAQLLSQWVSYIVSDVNSLYLNVFLFEIIMDEVESLFYVLRLLMRLQLLSKGYDTIIVTVEWNHI